MKCLTIISGNQMGKKINNKKKPKKLVNNTKSPQINKNIVIDLSECDFKSISEKNIGFSNFYKNGLNFSDTMYTVLEKIIKIASDYKRTDISKAKLHYHRSEATLPKVYQKKYPDVEFYQMGFNGVRIFGYFQENVYKVLFIDPHHLIEASQDYNNKDYLKYSYCWFNENIKSNKK